MGKATLPSMRELIKESWNLCKGKRPAFLIATIALATASILHSFAIEQLCSQLNLTGLTKFALSIPGSYIVAPIIAGGLISMSLAASRDEQVDFRDVISEFPRWRKYVITYALESVLIIIGFLCLILPGVYLSICYYFSFFLIADTGMSGWQALEVSRKVVTPHWFYVLGFNLLLVLMNIFGMAFLLIGFFWTFPVTLVAYGLLYRQLFTEQAIAEALGHVVTEPPKSND